MCTKFQHSSSSGSRDIKLRKASRRAGSGRAGPCHIKNGLYMEKEKFWYQSDLSTTIFKDFMSCLFFPYTCGISSLSLAIKSSTLIIFRVEQFIYEPNPINTLHSNTEGQFPNFTFFHTGFLPYLIILSQRAAA